MRSLVAAVVLVAALGSPARATTIDPLTWQQLIIDADFVGIVECTKAGGVVAEYEVVETWKGEKPGATISIRVAPDYWGPQFPIALVGEKYFVTAYEAAPSTMASTTIGGPVPVWWRNLPADYRLPLFQGRVELPIADDAEHALWPVGARDHEDLDALKKDAKALLDDSAAAQELVLYKVLAKKYFTNPNYQRKGSAHVKKLYKRIAKQKKVEDVVDLLIDLTKDEAVRQWHWSVRTILEQAGRAETLAILKKMNAPDFPGGRSDYDWVVKAIEIRLGKRQRPTRTAPAPTRPAPNDLLEMRRKLTGDPTPEEFYEVFPVLTKYDPGPVAAYLAAWESPGKHWSDAERGYAMGSYFAAECGSDCETHLETLLEAKDEYIRVAAGVYLTFHDKKKGMKALRKLCRLDGDPGVWAALALARRGVEGAVPRLLKVFADDGDKGSMASVNHRNLQSRALVLLSNSAAASGVAQPERDKGVVYYAAWYKTNRKKLKVADPWLPALRKQKVD